MSSVTRAEFAALMGWSRPYVSKLGKQGKLVLDDSDREMVAETQALLKKTADTSKQAVADRQQAERVQKGVEVYVAPDAPDMSETPHSEQCDYQASRAKREHHLAQRADAEARKAADELVERAAVEQ